MCWHLMFLGTFGCMQMLQAVNRCVWVQEVSKHPVVRGKVRDLVRSLACVFTRPTDTGDQILTPFHVHGSVKRVNEKPASILMQTAPQQWLHMLEAEKDGLLVVRPPRSLASCWHHSSLLAFLPPLHDLLQDVCINQKRLLRNRKG
jgi:hypothetical protein